MKTRTELTLFSSLNKFYLVLLTLLIAGSTHAQEASIKVVISEVSTDHIEAELMIKSNTAEPFVLGEHNIRMYYNAAALIFEPTGVKSKLPQAYDEPELIESLAFDVKDDSMASYSEFGFLNFSVNMKDAESNSMIVDGAWHLLMVISFETKNPIKFEDLIVASIGSTSKYASAYTELTKWISPNETKALKVIVESNEIVGNRMMTKSDIDIKIGPNPTADFVYIASSEVLKKLSLISMDGQRLLLNRVNDTRASLNISDIQSGKYILELIDASGRIWNEQIIKI